MRLLLLTIFLSPALDAEVLTVGPTGSFRSLDDAVSAARRSDEVSEIRVAPGTYRSYYEVHGPVLISGGWNETFDHRTEDPNATSIWKTYLISSRAITVENLTLEGHEVSEGNEWIIALAGRLVMRDVVFRGWKGTAVQSQGRALLSLTDCVFTGNTVVGKPLVRVVQSGSLELHRVEFYDNLVPEHGSPLVEYRVSNSFHEVGLRLADVHVYGNHYLGELENALINVEAPYHPESFWYAPKAIVERLRIRESLEIHMDLLRLTAAAVDSEFVVSDSLIQGSGRWGVHATAGTDSRIRLTNLTVTKNAKGVHMFATSDASVALNNSIVTGNGGANVNAVGPTTFLSRNWIGEDPGFVDPDSGDFRLRLDAPAVDTGRRMFRTGLGDLDLDGNPRVAGWEVDAGAYEAQTGTPPTGPSTPPCLASSTTTLGKDPAYYDTPICNCFRDKTHPTTQCSLEIPGWPGLNLRFITPEIAFDPKLAPEPGGWQIASNSAIPFQTRIVLDGSAGSYVLATHSGETSVKPKLGEFHFPKVLKQGDLLRSVLYFGDPKLGEELAIEVLLDPEQLIGSNWP